MGGPTRVNGIILDYSVHTFDTRALGFKAHLGEYTDQMEIELDQTFPGAYHDLSETCSEGEAIRAAPSDSREVLISSGNNQLLRQKQLLSNWIDENKILFQTWVTTYVEGYKETPAHRANMGNLTVSEWKEAWIRGDGALCGLKPDENLRKISITTWKSQFTAAPYPVQQSSKNVQGELEWKAGRVLEPSASSLVFMQRTRTKAEMRYSL